MQSLGFCIQSQSKERIAKKETPPEYVRELITHTKRNFSVDNSLTNQTENLQSSDKTFT